MIKLIIGEKGTGKTKTMLEDVNKTVDVTEGSVIFINSGQRHVYDLSYKIRLIDTSEFDMRNFSTFYGLLCGLAAQNFDITHVYVDSLSKVVKQNLDATGMAELEKCLELCDKLCEEHKVKLFITLSVDPTTVPASFKKYQ